MTTFLENGLYERDRQLALETLGEALGNGELALLLGSGCSRDVGLPDWKELVNRCCEHPLTKAKNPSIEAFSLMEEPKGEDFFRRMEKVRIAINDTPRYLKVVQDSLYDTLGATLVTSPSRVLQGLGSLIMGSQRGKVSEVITLNFDCVLESYLTMHGFVVQVVENWPKLLVGSDVCIYHPHGYLPMKDMGVASAESYLTRFPLIAALGLQITPGTTYLRTY